MYFSCSQDKLGSSEGPTLLDIWLDTPCHSPPKVPKSAFLLCIMRSVPVRSATAMWGNVPGVPGCQASGRKEKELSQNSKAKHKLSLQRLCSIV
jgi:hypothetical protein